KTLESCVKRIDEIADAARSIREDVLVICHGGPIAEPDDAAFIIGNCKAVNGFYGASSVERLPAERAIAEQIRRFKAIRLPSGRIAAGKSNGSPKKGKVVAR